MMIGKVKINISLYAGLIQACFLALKFDSLKYLD